MNHLIKLSDEQKKAMKEAIYTYYLDERGEDIGIILQEGLLDLFILQTAGADDCMGILTTTTAEKNCISHII